MKWSNLSTEAKIALIFGLVTLPFVIFGPVSCALSEEKAAGRLPLSSPTLVYTPNPLPSATTAPSTPIPTPTPTTQARTLCPAKKFAGLQGVWQGQVTCNGQNLTFQMQSQFKNAREMRARVVLNEIESQEADSRDLDIELVGYFDDQDDRVVMRSGSWDVAIGYPALTLAFSKTVATANRIEGDAYDRVQSDSTICGPWIATRKRAPAPQEGGARGQTSIVFNRHASEQVTDFSGC